MESGWRANIEEKIVVALLAVAAGLFGVLAAHRLTLWRERQSTIRSAAIEFRAGFSNEIAAMANASAIDIFHILADALTKHKGVIDRALPFLGKKDAARLALAWEAYCGERDGYGLESDLYVLGYSHPERIQLGKERFRALYSCLDRFVI